MKEIPFLRFPKHFGLKASTKTESKKNAATRKDIQCIANRDEKIKKEKKSLWDYVCEYMLRSAIIYHLDKEEILRKECFRYLLFFRVQSLEIIACPILQ